MSSPIPSSFNSYKYSRKNTGDSSQEFVNESPNFQIRKDVYGAAASSPSLSSYYPYTATNAAVVPQIQSRGNRVHYFGRKLAFWKKKQRSATDVYSAMYTVTKSHEKYRNDLAAAVDAIRDWTDYLAPPSLIAEDLLQHQMMDVNLSQWLASLIDSIVPVVDSERKCGEVYAAMVHSLETIKKEEANIKLSLRKQSCAERKYFKAMANEWSAAESQRLDQERIRLVADVDSATDQFRMACRRELPVRFNQLLLYFEQLEREIGRASQSIHHLLNSEESMICRRVDEPFCSERSESTYDVSPNAVPPLKPPKIAPLQPSRIQSPPSPQAVTTPASEPEDYSSKQPVDVNAELAGLESGEFVWK